MTLDMTFTVERWPIAGTFTIARGAKTVAEVQDIAGMSAAAVHQWRSRLRNCPASSRIG